MGIKSDMGEMMGTNSTDHSGRQRIKKWLRLHLTDGIGPKRFATLLEYFGDVDAILSANIGQLCSVPGIRQKTAHKLVVSRDGLDIDGELELAEKLGVQILTWESPEYPPLLKQTHNPPPVLYVKGKITREDNLAVAIVGSRSCSQYGREQAARLSHLLAAAGFTIVSGLARGIDAQAHRGALAAEGRTIAVQGRGLAEVYPPENKDLAARIAENGAVVSELPLKFAPLASTFPARNRIISGLSLGTLVVEARRNSGALITAKLSLEQNREVMAVPGRVDAPGSMGPHRLIKDGAALVEGIDDILNALGHVGQILEQHAEKTTSETEKKLHPSLFDTGKIPLSEAESQIIAALDSEPVQAEDVIQRTNLHPGEVYANLTALQLKGLVKQLPGGFYCKR